jgi:hypothetical protein
MLNFNCSYGCGRKVLNQGRCGFCAKIKQNDKRNLNNLYDVLGEKPPSKKPRRTDNSDNSSALSRQSSHSHHAGSSSNPNYSSGAPPAPVPPPIPMQDPAQRHKTRPAEQRPVPPPVLPPATDNKTCKLCNSAFDRPSKLKRHTDTVHKKIRPFACDICGFRFGEKSHLKKHNATVHEDQRPYSCTQCPAAFGQKSDLTQHVRTNHERDRSATNRQPANQRESSGSRNRPIPIQPRPSRWFCLGLEDILQEIYAVISQKNRLFSFSMK